MKKLKLMSALFLMAMSFVSFGQETGGNNQSKIIAVINRANWCTVCKLNGERFGATIMPYTAKGLAIIMNDLTDDASIARSKTELKNHSVYKQIYETKRKGVGRAMQVCGMVHGKGKSMVSGIVTFIDAKTLKVLSEKSIAITDEEMKTTINELLKS